MKIVTLLMALLILPSAANAALITVGDQEYDVQWDIGFSNVDSLYGIDDQPWYGSQPLSEQFAAALGFVDDGDIRGNRGPRFVYETYNIPQDQFLRYRYCDYDDTGQTQCSFELTRYVFAFAHATPVAKVPEPASLGLLVLGLFCIAFTFRQRKGYKVIGSIFSGS